MDFRTYSDEELRAFLRAGCTSFDNKKLAEREALSRFVRAPKLFTEEELADIKSEVKEDARDDGYGDGYDDGYTDCELGRDRQV